MNLQQYKAISKDLYAEIEKLVEARGLKVTKINAGVDERLGEVRLSIRIGDPRHKGADGRPTSREAETFKLLAASGLMGLKPEWLGTTFRMSGKEFVVAGLNSRGTKVQLARDGKAYMLSVETFVRLMASPVAGSFARRAPVAANAQGS